MSWRTKWLKENITNAMENSVSAFENLFSEEDWNNEGPIVVKTPSERRTTAINKFLDSMVFVPGSPNNLKTYKMRDFHEYDNIPLSKCECSYDYCISTIIWTEVCSELGFNPSLIKQTSDVFNFVEYLTEITGVEFSVAHDSELLWASKLITSGYRSVVRGFDGNELVIGENNKLFVLDKENKKQENWNLKEFNMWKIPPIVFRVVCISEDFVEEKESSYLDSIRER